MAENKEIEDEIKEMNMSPRLSEGGYNQSHLNSNAKVQSNRKPLYAVENI